MSCGIEQEDDQEGICQGFFQIRYKLPDANIKKIASFRKVISNSLFLY